MRFTVMTPTFNRAHTLKGVYESLCQQTFRDFEWLIVDDGSTDGTSDLVASWNASFPIRYVWKPNGGKHTAMNAGTSLAKGEFVLFFDSDDRCTPNALERFDYHWRHVPDPSRFASVSCLCCTPGGAIIGDAYPADCADVYNFADQIRYRKYERWGINRTDILLEFPFPEEERYVSESLIWNRISRKYAARFVNEPLRIYEPNPSGIFQNAIALRISSPKSTLLYYKELVLSPAPILQRMRAAINFCRFAGLTVLSRPRFDSRSDGERAGGSAAKSGRA